MDIREIQPGETGSAFLAMQELRTHLTDEAEFVRLVDEVQRPEGYRIAGAFDKEEPNSAAAVAGFRVGNNLADGHYLYVDDLATRPEFRRRGLGTALLVWLAREAAGLGCEHLSLDSAVGPQRADAHRLYLNAGLMITAHHFEREL
jgi:GNAT superfamily N-acetyltransferase